MLDTTDRKIINALQGGFPVCDRPFAAAAKDIGLEEQDLMDRVSCLRESGVLSHLDDGAFRSLHASGGHGPPAGCWGGTRTHIRLLNREPRFHCATQHQWLFLRFNG